MHRHALTGLILASMTISAQAQFSVLDDGPSIGSSPVAEATSAALPPCGSQPISVVKMGWPSAALLAEIHGQIIAQAYGCDVQMVQGDLAVTASTMGSALVPTVAPEMWVSRVADVWNGAMDSQLVRSAAPSYDTQTFEGWFMPTLTAQLFTAGPSLVNLAEAIPLLSAAQKIPFITCPADWACSVYNRNLIQAVGIQDLIEVIEPTNRLAMDKLIAEAVNKREPFLFYYWQPNAILAQLEFTPVEMGPYNEAAAKCLSSLICSDPEVSAFPLEAVTIAVSEKLVGSAPLVAGYFQRASFPLKEMDRLLAELSAPGASEASVAAGFVQSRGDLWRNWVGQDTP